MADVNFLKFPFFAYTSLGYYKSGHVGEGLAAAFIHTCSGRAQKIPFSMATLDPRGGKTAFLGEGGLTRVQDGKNSWWLAGRPAGATSALECLGLLINNAQKQSHFSPSPGMYGSGSEVECQEALITCLQLGSLLSLQLYSSYNLSQSSYTGANQCGGGGKAGRPIFIGKQYLEGCNAVVLDERKEIWKK